MGRSDALIEILSRTIVRSQNSCLANAQNAYFLTVNQARNVDISDMSIMQLAQTDARCTRNIEVDVGSLEFDIDRTVRATIQASEAGSGSTVFDLQNKIKHVMVTDEVQTCLSDAKNEYQAQFGTIQGDFKAKGNTIHQVATSTMTRCLQSGKFKIGDVSLPNYLDTVLEQTPSIQIIPPSEPLCESAKQMYYGFAGAALGCIIIAAILLLWHKYKPIRK
jgi:hypothetical protein